MSYRVESKGLESLDKELRTEVDGEIERRFAAAEAIAHETLAELQAHIHMQTGRLRASAHLDVARTPETFEATFVVGGAGAPYAVYENARTRHSIWGPLEWKAENEFSDAFGGRPSESHGSLNNRGRQAATE